MEGALVFTGASGAPDSLLTRVRGAGRWRRLGPKALERRGAPPEELPKARAALGDAPIDVNFVPLENRRKRLLICDMDSTVITVECIDEIADFAGVKPEVAAITERAMQGEIDFAEALRARVALLEGLREATLEQVYAERVALSPGARVLARTMAALGAETALVSGGFTFFTERVAAAAGFARHQANTLIAGGGRLSGTVADPILGREAKQEALVRICAEKGFAPADAVAVGDGANDLDMLRTAGLGVAYRAKPVVAAEAAARLDHSDLTAILHLQGLTAAEFVTD
ncbi:MAG: phosphoserine phosphatase SerB [Pseudomonadota bacterium]